MKRIRTFAALMKAVDNRRAVVVPSCNPWKQPKPAAIIIHLPGLIVHRLLKRGIYLYEKKK